MPPSLTHDHPPFRTAARTADEALAEMGAPELLARTRALQWVTDAALAHLSLDDLLDALLARVRQLLNTDTATALLDSGGDRLVVRASQGLAEEVEDEVSVLLGQGIAGQVAVRREAVMVDDVRRLEVASPRLRRLSSMVVAPMLAEGTLVGVLHAGTFRPRVFTDADLHLLQVIADRAALAIKHALVFSGLQRELALRTRAETELGESERRFRLMVESVKDYAIFLLDPEGRITSWNAGAERIKGYRADEVLGRHFSIFYTPESAGSGHPAYELEVAEREGRFEEEGCRVRKDGSLFWASVIITAVWDEGRLIGFAKVTRDLTERRAAERQREDLLVREREARKAAEAANQAKSEFLAVMSHELRTPLTAVLGYADLLLQGVPVSLPPGSGRFVERIRASGQHLLGVIEEILAFSSMEAGATRVAAERADLGAIVRDAAALVEPQARARGIEVRLHLPDQPLRAVTDPGKVRQVLAALLVNAVNFTSAGHVAVDLREAEGAAEFRVTDTGVGIALEHHESIFEPFWQVEQSQRREVGGTGLGLAIVRRLARLLGGDVSVESEAGRGSTFTVTLPLGEGA